MFHNEDEFVRWLRKRLPSAGFSAPVGIGDDAAVVRIRGDFDCLLTADLSIEGVHFSARWHSPRVVGHRALARSLSDIAAMGGAPRFALVSLAISNKLTRRWLEEFYKGLAELAARFGVRVIGGDTARVKDRAAIDVTVVGEVRRGYALTRSGARAGDLIYVSGRLGQSELGLRCLRHPRRALERNLSQEHRAAAVEAHLYPEPQCALGRFLSRHRIASAAIDVSDGFALDLSRIAKASGVGARIVERQISGPAGVPRKLAEVLALHGGEDYQLLFTVPLNKASRLPGSFQGIPIHCLGAITASRELRLVREDGQAVPLKPLGYDHFRKR